MNKEPMDAAHKSSWQTFEVIAGIPFLAAIVLQFMVPLSLPQWVPSSILIPAGIAFIFAGVTLIILSRREFVRRGQPTDPGHSTSRLITTGTFSISRNPLYLGGILIAAGAGMVFNLIWVLMLLPVMIAACHYILIVPEEGYLSSKFGAEYQSYAESVCRWIGRSAHRRDG